MPQRASYFLIPAVLLTLAGCTSWPTPEHRAVTNDSIRAIMDDVVADNPVPVPPDCTDLSQLEAVSKALGQQTRQFDELNDQLKSLVAANPNFASSECQEPAGAAALDGKTIIGSSEWIYLTPPGHHYQARVDSGAATSSLSAQNITRFERNGEKWVRFFLQHDDEAQPIEVEAPLVRHVRIRQASADEVDRRPVVSLTVNLGNNLQQDTEFNLTDRSQMTYPILLGRQFLRDVTLIDVGREFIHPKFEPDPVPENKKSDTGGKTERAVKKDNKAAVADKPAAVKKPAAAKTDRDADKQAGQADTAPAQPSGADDNAAPPAAEKSPVPDEAPVKTE